MIFMLANQVAIAASDSDHWSYKKKDWSFEGVFGTFDYQSIQRGFQVYREVCSSCHGLKRVYYRNLLDIGFPKEEIEILASESLIEDGPNDDGEMFERPRKLSDVLPSPYPNEKAARAVNNGAYPPDLSLIYKARMDGANYIYSLLTGFEEIQPEGFELGDNMYFNPYFSQMQISMAPPLQKDLLEYRDGTPATIEQMSIDVVNFLQWVAEPEMQARKNLGHKVILYLLILTILFYIAKQIIWKDVEKD